MDKFKKNIKKGKAVAKSASSKKGFTLIELLAVIVIMGVLMITAIPAITQAIARSRRDTFATNAKKLIDSVRNGIADEEFVSDVGGSNVNCQLPPIGKTLAIDLMDKSSSERTIDYLLERGANKSAFGQDYVEGYVFIQNDGEHVENDGVEEDVNNYVYYIYLRDKGNNGTNGIIKEAELQRNKISVAGAAVLGREDSENKKFYISTSDTVVEGSPAKVYIGRISAPFEENGLKPSEINFCKYSG